MVLRSAWPFRVCGGGQPGSSSKSSNEKGRSDLSPTQQFSTGPHTTRPYEFDPKGRTLTYHPHLHVVVPGGGVEAKQRQWKRTRYQYLFNEFALAEVFRGKSLAGIAKAGLSPPSNLPEKWVVDCTRAGRGESALEYLARYLYRGVISETNVIADHNGQVTFRYTDGETGQVCTETLPGADFLWRVIQHVLPRGFHRVRDYGFLHHNARKTLQLIQLILQTALARKEPEQRPCFRCRACGEPMVVVAVRPFRAGPGVPSGQGPPEAGCFSLVSTF